MTDPVPSALDGGYLPAPDLKQAEMAVVGAAISSQRSAEEAAALLRPAHFHYVAHQVVFEAVTRLAGDGQPVSPASVLTELTRTREIGNVGGAPHLHTLMAAGEAWALGANARRIRADFARRSMHIAATRIAQVAAGADFDPETSADLARKMLDEALADAAGVSDAAAPTTAGELYAEALTRLEDPESLAGLIAPPWPDLRDLIPVLRPGQLITIGARPGVGKSMCAGDLLRHAGLRLHVPAILFALEMSCAEVTDRMLAAEASVELGKIQSASLDDRDWDRIGRLAERFGDGTLVIDDTPAITTAHVRARLNGMARTAPAELAIIDYLQLMRGSGRAESREREIAEITASLKEMAREFAIPVVLLAQLNRGPESRSDHRPVKADLRESGSIENNSDVVILIHRPGLHDPDCDNAADADLIVDKNRAGPTGIRTVQFQGHYGRFVSREWTPTTVVGSSR